MEDWEDRLEAEHSELCFKLEKLLMFIGGEVFDSIPTDKQNKLREQAIIMRAYSDILQERLEKQ